MLEKILAQLNGKEDVTIPASEQEELRTELSTLKAGVDQTEQIVQNQQEILEQISTPEQEDTEASVEDVVDSVGEEESDEED